MQKERVVFQFHALSELLLGASLSFTFVMMGWPDDAWPAVVAALSIHGIYSLSFLSLWALAGAGYSIAILEHLSEFQQNGRSIQTHRLEEVGVGKQGDRLSGLHQLGLIQEDGGIIKLTSFGRVVATGLAATAATLNVRESG